MSLNITNTFVAHQDAKSEDINQNFSDIETWGNNNIGSWNNWTTTLKKADGSTSLNGTIDVARYCKIGKLIFAKLTLSSVADPNGLFIYFTLPFTPSTIEKEVNIGNGHINASGISAKLCRVTIGANRTDAKIANSSDTALPNNGDLAIEINFFYEIN